MIKGLYIFLTLGIGTAITVVVSLACSYWFFSSLMGSTGYQAIGAGIAGCAIQLFGYGFSASFLRVHTIFRWMLCFIPLALSMLCTYSALYGYLAIEKQQQALVGKKQEIILSMLEQSAKDREVNTAAAKQSLSQRYRSQAKAYLQSNEQARANDEKLIEKLDSHGLTSNRVTPLDGLVRITGDSELTTVAFCAWLAVLFDILPVIAIAIITRRGALKRQSEDVRALGPTESVDPINNLYGPVVIVEAVENVVNAAPAAPTELSERDIVSYAGDEGIGLELESDLERESNECSQGAHLNEASHYLCPSKRPFVEAQNIYFNAVSQSTAPEEGSGASIAHEEVIVLLRNGTLKPNYKSVQEYTGWSQWKSQEFFKDCQEKGILQKEGRSFRILTNVTLLEPGKNVVNA